VSDQPTRRAPLPTNRGRRTQAAIDADIAAVIARKGILAATIADVATEAGRSTASFYNYYDSKEAMVREWALRFRDVVNVRAQPVTRHGDDFAQHWAEICCIPTPFIDEMVRRAQSDGYCAGDDPRLIAVAIVAMLNQFCYLQLAGPGPGPGGDPDGAACITTLANIFYQAIYCEEGR